MDYKIDTLSKLIYQEIINKDLIAKGQRSIKVSGFIAFIMWFVAIVFFIFTTTYIHDHITKIILLCCGGLFILLGLLIPLIWITKINFSIKKYYLNIFQEKKIVLFKLSINIFNDIKMFENDDGSISIEKGNNNYLLSNINNLSLSTKFNLSKGKSYYLIISQSISEQIAEFIINKLENVWKI